MEVIPGGVSGSSPPPREGSGHNERREILFSSGTTAAVSNSMSDRRIRASARRFLMKIESIKVQFTAHLEFVSEVARAALKRTEV